MRKHKENQLMGKITKTKELRNASHVEESLEKLLGGIINSILEAEMDEHLGSISMYLKKKRIIEMDFLKRL